MISHRVSGAPAWLGPCGPRPCKGVENEEGPAGSNPGGGEETLLRVDVGKLPHGGSRSPTIATPEELMTVFLA